jgi:hypothetical protein
VLVAILGRLSVWRRQAGGAFASGGDDAPDGTNEHPEAPTIQHHSRQEL